MDKYTVEMAYGINIAVDVDAENEVEAIKEAKRLVENDKTNYIDLDEVNFIDFTYVCEK